MSYVNFGQYLGSRLDFGLRIVYNHHFIKCIVFFGNKIGHYANACQWRRNVLFLGKPSRVGGSKENLIGTNCFWEKNSLSSYHFHRKNPNKRNNCQKMSGTYPNRPKWFRRSFPRKSLQSPIVWVYLYT